MDIEEENIKIAEFLRIEREKNKIPFRKLSKKAKVANSALFKLEGSEGFEFNPKLNTLRNILSCYNKTLLDLFQYVYQKSDSEKQLERKVK